MGIFYFVGEAKWSITLGNQSLIPHSQIWVGPTILILAPTSILRSKCRQ